MSKRSIQQLVWCVEAYLCSEQVQCHFSIGLNFLPNFCLLHSVYISQDCQWNLTKIETEEENEEEDEEAVPSSVQFSQYDIYAIRKTHKRYTLSLRSFPSVGFETVPMLV